MTFADNFQQLKILNFDFRKYQSFFYQFTDNEHTQSNIFGSHSNLRVLNLEIDTWTRNSIQKLISNFYQLEEINIKYTILASEIKNIKRDNSSRQILDLRQNKLLKKISLDIDLEECFLQALSKKNIKLNFNFNPIFLARDQLIESLSVKASNFNVDFNQILPLQIFEKEAKSFYWNVKKFDLICG
jgi:hypothetical protein